MAKRFLISICLGLSLLWGGCTNDEENGPAVAKVKGTSTIGDRIGVDGKDIAGALGSLVFQLVDETQDSRTVWDATSLPGNKEVIVDDGAGNRVNAKVIASPCESGDLFAVQLPDGGTAIVVKGGSKEKYSDISEYAPTAIVIAKSDSPSFGVIYNQVYGSGPMTGSSIDKSGKSFNYMWEERRIDNCEISTSFLTNVAEQSTEMLLVEAVGLLNLVTPGISFGRTAKQFYSGDSILKTLEGTALNSMTYAASPDPQTKPPKDGEGGSSSASD